MCWICILTEKNVLKNRFLTVILRPSFFFANCPDVHTTQGRVIFKELKLPVFAFMNWRHSYLVNIQKMSNRIIDMDSFICISKEIILLWFPLAHDQGYCWRKAFEKSGINFAHTNRQNPALEVMEISTSNIRSTSLIILDTKSW